MKKKVSEGVPSKILRHTHCLKCLGFFVSFVLEFQKPWGSLGNKTLGVSETARASVGGLGILVLNKSSDFLKGFQNQELYKRVFFFFFGTQNPSGTLSLTSSRCSWY